jgi:hypothetical protein
MWEARGCLGLITIKPDVCRACRQKPSRPDACPACGSTEGEREARGCLAAITINPVVCRGCGQKWLPPPPRWQGVPFIALGSVIGLLGLASLLVFLPETLRGDHVVYPGSVDWAWLMAQAWWVMGGLGGGFASFFLLLHGLSVLCGKAGRAKLMR